MPKLTSPTLALILAGGLATGVALARPASPAPVVVAADAAVSEDAGTGSNRAVPRNAPGYDGQGATDRAAGDAPADAASGDAAPNDAAPAAAVSVVIEDFAFQVGGAVGPGGPITVTNRDGAPHTLTFDDGSVDTGTIDGGGTVEVTAPDAPGTYRFFCEIHPSMTGELVVG
ncbi:MAG: cupredoxin domain-containing protein [Actinomycetota bacterium]